MKKIQNFYEKIYKLLEKKEVKKLLTALLVICLLCLQADVASATTAGKETEAATLDKSALVNGTKKLIEDAVKVVQILGPLVAGVMAAFQGIKLSSADDNEVPAIKKKMKVIIIGGIICLLGGTLLDIIFKYYAPTASK